MEIDFDPTKNEKNIRERGLSFEKVADFNWGDAVVNEDTRKSYPERRYVAAGYLEGRLHMLCFAETDNGIRIISFRKANTREARSYDKTFTAD